MHAALPEAPTDETGRMLCRPLVLRYSETARIKNKKFSAGCEELPPQSFAVTGSQAYADWPSIG